MITAPTYVIAASEDKMHVFDQTLEIVRRLPNAIKFDDVRYYHKTHTREIAERIANFILKIEKETKSTKKFP
ncbi:MAG: alpha/beta fold hydrolase [Candidatus Heimdallarchaeaceae archaeon]